MFVLEHCLDGDVKWDHDGSEGQPFVFWDKQWVPLCGHFFWDNDDGATLFCKKLGYNSGTVIPQSGQKYSVDSFRIGVCKEGDSWLSCSGGRNDYKIGGSFDTYPSAKCDVLANVKIHIKCRGGENIKTSSCRSTYPARI